MEEVKILNIDAWSSNLSVIITDNINECIRKQAELKKFDHEKYLLEDKERFDGLVMDFCEEELTGTVMFLIYSKIDYRLIVHETSHAVFHILSNRGVELNEYTTEAFAYLEDYIFSETLKFFEEVKTKIDFKSQPELPLVWGEEEK